MCMKSLKIQKWQSQGVNRITDNAMTKRTMIYKTLHRKPNSKIEQQKPHPH